MFLLFFSREFSQFPKIGKKSANISEAKLETLKQLQIFYEGFDRYLKNTSKLSPACSFDRLFIKASFAQQFTTLFVVLNTVSIINI